jgi:hypothetical protein
MGRSSADNAGRDPDGLSPYERLRRHEQVYFDLTALFLRDDLNGGGWPDQAGLDKFYEADTENGQDHDRQQQWVDQVTGVKSHPVTNSIDTLWAFARSLNGGGQVRNGTEPGKKRGQLELAPVVSPDLQAAWEAAANAAVGPPYEPSKEGVPMGPEQWLVLITCRDEPHQVELLKRFQTEGLDCRALLS